MKNIYSKLLSAKHLGQKFFAVLIDPDKTTSSALDATIQLAIDNKVDCFFIGSSLLINNNLSDILLQINSKCSIPTLLFPGNEYQIDNKADALLFLSLISGRNPEMLIGKHVITAPLLKKSTLEVISTGYMLIDGGVLSSVQYMSNTNPIPSNKPDIAVSTALAGEYLGMKLIYMDAGSGAKFPITRDMIQSVASNISIPLIVGGGIRSAESAYDAAQSGADIIVVGNAIEKDNSLISEISDAIHHSTKIIQI